MENTPAINAVLRRLQSKDLNEVVKLHRSAFTYTLNSKLGNQHLKKLYSAMLEDPDSLVLVAIKNHLVLGVVSATKDPEEFKKKFKAGLSFAEKFALAGRMLFHPMLILDVLRERPVIYQNKIVNGCLTAVAVDLQCRKSGIGRALVVAIEDFFKKLGDPCFYLFTRADNTVSRKFYERLGFMELEQRGKDVVLIKEVH